MNPIHNFAGLKRGMIVVTARAPNGSHNHPCWYVDCECGNKQVSVRAQALRKGVDHCGCKYSPFGKKNQKRGRRSSPPPLTSATATINRYLYQYRPQEGV